MQRLFPLVIFDIKETNGFKNLSENPSEQEPAMVLLIRDFFHIEENSQDRILYVFYEESKDDWNATNPAGGYAFYR